jgi:hypothetical protein
MCSCNSPIYRDAAQRSDDQGHEPGAGGVGDHRHGRDGENPAMRSGPWASGCGRARPRRSPRPRPSWRAPGRPCRGPAGRRACARGRRRRRPRRRPGPSGAPSPRGTAPAGRLGRRGSAPGWGSRCTRRTRPARAAARLVLGAVGTDGGVVRLLGLPGDDPVLDVDLPAARAGAVHPVGRTHDLVVAPAAPVEDVSFPAPGPEDRVPVRAHLRPGEIAAEPEAGLRRLSRFRRRLTPPESRISLRITTTGWDDLRLQCGDRAERPFRYRLSEV